MGGAACTSVANFLVQTVDIIQQSTLRIATDSPVSCYNLGMLKQRTIKQIVKTVGVGLHSGTKVELTLRPSAPDTGILFRRVDLTPVVDFPAAALGVGDTRMASTLIRDGAKVSTVEHLMSALCGLGIDNVRVELDGPEVPIMDGSAAPFAYLIKTAGVRVLDQPKSFIVIKKPVRECSLGNPQCIAKPNCAHIIFWA